MAFQVMDPGASYEPKDFWAAELLPAGDQLDLVLEKSSSG